MTLTLEYVRNYLDELALWLCGPNGGSAPLLMLRVLADESHDDRRERVMTFGGLIAPKDQWASFWFAWASVLNEPEFGVRGFHAADCEKGEGLFRGWERPRIEALQQRLIGLITSSEYGIKGYAVSFPIGAHAAQRDVLKTFAFLDGGSVNGPLDDPWFFGFLSLIVAVVDDPRPFIPAGEQVGFFFDRHHLQARGEAIYSAMESAGVGGGRLKKGGVAFEDREHAVPLQAADLFAYEVFRYRLDTGLDHRPERWHHKSLRSITALSSWIDEQGLIDIVGGAKSTFLKAVPSPTPPKQARSPRRRYQPTLRERFYARLKRCWRSWKRWASGQ